MQCRIEYVPLSNPEGKTFYGGAAAGACDREEAPGKLEGIVDQIEAAPNELRPLERIVPLTTGSPHGIVRISLCDKFVACTRGVPMHVAHRARVFDWRCFNSRHVAKRLCATSSPVCALKYVAVGENANYCASHTKSIFRISLRQIACGSISGDATMTGKPALLPSVEQYLVVLNVAEVTAERA